MNKYPGMTCEIPWTKTQIVRLRHDVCLVKKIIFFFSLLTIHVMASVVEGEHSHTVDAKILSRILEPLAKQCQDMRILQDVLDHPRHKSIVLCTQSARRRMKARAVTPIAQLAVMYFESVVQSRVLVLDDKKDHQAFLLPITIPHADEPMQKLIGSFQPCVDTIIERNYIHAILDRVPLADAEDMDHVLKILIMLARTPHVQTMSDRVLTMILLARYYEHGPQDLEKFTRHRRQSCDDDLYLIL